MNHLATSITCICFLDQLLQLRNPSIFGGCFLLQALYLTIQVNIMDRVQQYSLQSGAMALNSAKILSSASNGVPAGAASGVAALPLK